MKKTLMVLTVLAAAAIVAAPAMAANTLTVPAGGLNGTNFLLKINVDPTVGIVNPVYVESAHPTDETHLLIRFRLKFDELEAPATGAGRNFRLLNIGDDSATATPHKILFLQRQGVGAHNWRLLAWTYTNGGLYEFVGGFFLGNFHGTNERQIECEWTKATAANGEFGCNRTDTPLTQFFVRTDISDSNYQGDYVQAGFFDFDAFPGAAGLPGNLKFDEYESYR